MATLPLFGALLKISRTITKIKYSHAVQIRCMASEAQERKHMKLKLVDNVGTVVYNSAEPTPIMGNSGHIRKKQKMCANDTTEDVFSDNTQEFLEVVEKYAFVDHSLLIKVFFKKGMRLFVSAPKMFCKSTNISMIKRFYGIREDGLVEVDYKKRHRYAVFKELKIMKDNPDEQELNAHFCSHPVIQVDFKASKIREFKDAVDYCYEAIRLAFKEHQHFLERNLPDEGDKARCEMWWKSRSSEDFNAAGIATALAFLCRCLYTAHKGKRVIILVDECDAIITSAIESGCNWQTLKDISGFMTSIFSRITKGEINDLLQGVLLTGISYISGVGFSTDIKTTNCRFLDDTSKQGISGDTIVRFYGLHQDDLDGLISKVKPRLKLSDKDIPMKKAEISQLLNGYHTIVNQKCIYPLYKVVDFLIKGELDYNYNTNTATIIEIYSKAASHPDFLPTILRLLANKTVKIDNLRNVGLGQLVNLRDNPNVANLETYLLLLLETGFLTHTEDKLRFKIPNQLTAYYFQKMLWDQSAFAQFHQTNMIKCADDVESLINLLLANDDEGFKRKLLDFYQHLKIFFESWKTSSLETQEKLNESSIKAVLYVPLLNKMGPSVVHTEYHMRDKNDNRGFIDILIIIPKKKVCVVVEIKVEWLGEGVNRKGSKEKTSAWALNEIKGEGYKKVNYSDAFKEKDIMHYIFCGISVDSSYRPSISVSTSMDEGRPFSCASETEPNAFPELYGTGKCIDLLKLNSQ